MRGRLCLLPLSSRLSSTCRFSVGSGTVGSPVTLTATPHGGLSWPFGETLTPAATGLSGSFGSATLLAYRRHHDAGQHDVHPERRRDGLAECLGRPYGFYWVRQLHGDGTRAELVDRQSL